MGWGGGGGSLMHQLQEALSNVHLNYSVQKLSLKIHKRGRKLRKEGYPQISAKMIESGPKIQRLPNTQWTKKLSALPK